MTNAETKQESQEVRTCKLATASAVLGALALCSLLMAVLVRDVGTSSESTTQLVTGILSFGIVLCCAAALVVGIIALVKIRRSKGQLGGKSQASLGAGVAGLLILWGSANCILFQLKYGPGSELWVVLCKNNLHQLGLTMRLYANENESEYPTCSEWSDLLVQKLTHRERRSFAELFVCRGAKRKGDEERCHYAMNPSCRSNSPNDVVLLFETKGGWNQSGGSEILTAENHNGKGCSILFNNGSVEFVKTEDLARLKWKVEENK
jgi:hypothetical protein